jgi:hypothetical protein
MTAFQAYAEAPSAGQAGHLCANINGSNAARTLVRAVDAAIDCALAVTGGATAGKTVKAPTTAAEAAACLGVLLDPVYLNEIGATNSYSAGQPATIAEEAFMWVNSEGTVAYDDPVFVRILTDGSANTTKGTLTNTSDYPSGGIVITPSTPTQAATYLNLTLSDGTVTETFTVLTDASPTVAEIAAAFVTQIENSANFGATGTVTISVTSTSGIVEVIQAADCLAVTTAARAHRRPGWRWAKARTGAGLTKVSLQARR